ncbi:MAG: MarR family winged helix-turn-helix transcriptional regulator [Mycobacterium sp.]|uniref:MarR family winged helix-turn-helix transcriptional regulator n=1 Tax=Mycobacterium sp. TaxID=1785 RepID=UPI003F947EAE
MRSPGEDVHLETLTLRLLNRVVYATSSRGMTRQVRDVTGIDLPPSGLRLLQLLAGRPPVAASVLAAELTIDLSQVSRQAGQLEELGYLARTADPADRRRTLLALTPKTARLLDKWLLAWSDDYLRPVTTWPERDVVDLTRWFAVVHDRLDKALPGRPAARSAERWQSLVDPNVYEPAVRTFLSTVMGLVSWAGQSGGFDDLLRVVRAPIRQHGYFTLRVVARNGPMPIVDVAEPLGIDPSQASKRIRQLAELRLVDRAVDGFDRRSNLIRVSRKGAALLTKVRETQLTGFLETLGELPAADRTRWTMLMHRYFDLMLQMPEADGLIRALDEGSVSLP